MAVSSIRPSTLAIYYEATPGQDPVDAASTWPAEIDNTATGDRIYHYAVDPSALRAEFIPDARMSDRLGAQATHDPINGIRNSGDVSFQIPLIGTEAVTAVTATVAATGYTRLYEHALGAVDLGASSEITLVNSDTSIDPTTFGTIDAGSMFFVEDDDDQGRLHPIRVLTEDGTTATFDRAPYTGVHADDEVAGAAVCYIDEDALKNPADANASTISMMIVKDGLVYQGKGGVAELVSIEGAKGDVPKANFNARFSYVDVPGDGSIAEPTWVDTVQGAQPLVVGADLKLHMQNKGTTTLVCYDVISFNFTTGVGRPRIPTVTECTTNMQANAGHRYQAEPTILEIQVLHATEHQDDWDTKQARIVTLYQIAADGKAWAIHGADCVVSEPPLYTQGEEINLMTLRIEFREDRDFDATASNTNQSRSKFLLALG